MTPEAQRIAIAEECGWFKFCINALDQQVWHKVEKGQYSEFRVACFEELPNHLSDLNACHEMEKTLSKEEQTKYIIILGLDVLKMCPLAGDLWFAQEHESWAMTHATAAQRCEAFLRVKGRWIE